MPLSFYLRETLQKKSNPSPNCEITENETDALQPTIIVT